MTLWTAARQAPPSMRFSRQEYWSGPFYALPGVTTPVDYIQFDGNSALARKGTVIVRLSGNLVRHLRLARELLAKKSLEKGDVQRLAAVAQALLFYAGGWDPQQVAALTRSQSLLHAFPRMFLVVDTLYSITEVIGPQMRRGEWWGKLMDKVPSMHSLPSFSRRPTLHGRIGSFMRIVTALEIYRLEKRPDAKTVVSLKQIIFQHRFH